MTARFSSEEAFCRVRVPSLLTVWPKDCELLHSCLLVSIINLVFIKFEEPHSASWFHTKHHAKYYSPKSYHQYIHQKYYSVSQTQIILVASLKHDNVGALALNWSNFHLDIWLFSCLKKNLFLQFTKISETVIKSSQKITLKKIIFIFSIYTQPVEIVET